MAEFKLPKVKQGGKTARFERGAEHRSTTETIRVTVDFEPELHRRLKIYAAMEGKRLAELIRQWTDENTRGIPE